MDFYVAIGIVKIIGGVQWDVELEWQLMYQDVSLN